MQLGLSLALGAQQRVGGVSVTIVAAIPADATTPYAVTLPALPGGATYSNGTYGTLTITGGAGSVTDLSAYAALLIGQEAGASWTVTTSAGDATVTATVAGAAQYSIELRAADLTNGTYVAGDTINFRAPDDTAVPYTVIAGKTVIVEDGATGEKIIRFPAAAAEAAHASIVGGGQFLFNAGVGGLQFEVHDGTASPVVGTIDVSASDGAFFRTALALNAATDAGYARLYDETPTLFQDDIDISGLALGNVTDFTLGASLRRTLDTPLSAYGLAMRTTTRINAATGEVSLVVTAADPARVYVASAFDGTETAALAADAPVASDAPSWSGVVAAIGTPQQHVEKSVDLSALVSASTNDAAATYAASIGSVSGSTWTYTATASGSHSVTFTVTTERGVQTSATQAFTVSAGPAAFGNGDWTLSPGGDGQLLVNISALPTSGADLTALEYSLDSGSTWATLRGGVLLGQRSIDNLDETLGVGAPASVELRAKTASATGPAGAAKPSTVGRGENLISGATNALSGTTTIISGRDSPADLHFTWSTVGPRHRGWLLNDPDGIAIGRRLRVRANIDHSVMDDGGASTPWGQGFYFTNDNDIGSGATGYLDALDEDGVTPANYTGQHDETEGVVAYAREFTTDKVANSAGVANFTAPANGQARVTDVEIVDVPAVVTPSAGAGGDHTLTASAASPAMVNLGKTVDRVEIAAPAGVTNLNVLADMRAGLQVSATNAHVYEVTKTADDGTQGTLRHALTNAGSGATSGPRIVHFTVGGTITLTSNLTASRANTWVAGQTAPTGVLIWGDGRYNFHVEASNLVIENVDVLLGEPINSTVSESSNAAYIQKWNTGNPTTNVLVRNSGIGLSADQSPTITANTSGEIVSNVAFIDCIIGPMISAPDTTGTNANFHEANHHYGTLIAKNARRVGMHGVAHIGCRDRHPMLATGCDVMVAGSYTVDYVNGGGWPNNAVLVNILGTAQGYLDGDAPADRDVNLTAIANYGVPGGQIYDTHAGTISPYPTRSGGTGSGDVRVWTRGNRIDPTGISVTTPPVDKSLPSIGANGELNDFTGTPNVNFWSGSDGNDFIVLNAPPIWCEDFPPSHVEWVEANGMSGKGSRPADRIPFFDDAVADVETLVAESSLANRASLFKTSDPANANSASTGNAGAFTVPASPFTVASNGKTNIENALRTRAEMLGADSWGSINRALTTHLGGKLTVLSNGSVTWAVTADDVSEFGASTITATIRYDDGSTASVLTLGAST